MAETAPKHHLEIQPQRVLHLKKVLDAPANHSKDILLATLEALEALGPLSTELIFATGIGKSVRSLVKSAQCDAVRVRSNELLDKWKQEFRKRKADVLKGDDVVAESTNDHPAHGPASASSNSARCDGANVLAQSLHGEDPRRSKVRDGIFEALSKEGSSESPAKLVALASSIEKELHKQLIQKDYNVQCRSVLFNLKRRDNTKFRTQLISGLLPPGSVPTLTADEMASDELSNAKAQIRRCAMEEVQLDWDIKHSQDIRDGLFTCPKCGSKKTTYNQAQLGHGLDEPLTTLVTCFACNNRWKFDDIGASADADG